MKSLHHLGLGFLFLCIAEFISCVISGWVPTYDSVHSWSFHNILCIEGSVSGGLAKLVDMVFKDYTCTFLMGRSAHDIHHIPESI